MSYRLALATAIVLIGFSGCRRDKEPSADNPDVVARTVGQDLTIARMSALLANTKPEVALTPENGVLVADLWSNYQRLAFAAAHGDTLESHIGAAITPILNNGRVIRLLEVLRRSLPGDTATEAAYDSGSRGLYVLRDLLLAYPPRATVKQRDSVRAEAVALRRAINGANFRQMAQHYSANAQTAAKGGYLGVVAKSTMNPAAVAVVTALEPDSVSKLLQTQGGFEILQRVSWADAKSDFVPAFDRAIREAHDSLLTNRAAQAANVAVTARGPEAARGGAAYPPRGSRDTTTIAIFNRLGTFTVADMLAWVDVMPVAQRAQLLKTLPQQSDAAVSVFIRWIAARAVLLRMADSAGIVAPDSVRTAFRSLLLSDIVRVWKGLGVAPDQLADSATTPAEREQVAARRVESLFERGMAGQVRLQPVSVPIEAALDAQYEAVVNSAALARAIEGARVIRSASGSAKPAGSGL